MQIRTITVGAREEDVARAAQAAASARDRLTVAGYTVQTLRLALSVTGSNRCADFAAVAQGAEALALDHGFDAVSIGRVDPERMAQLPDALAATSIVSASAKISGRDGLAEPQMIRAAAEAIVAIGSMTDGFGNMRFAASAAVGPGTPFFPAANHDGDNPWMAIGPEGAALAIEAAGVGTAELPSPLTELTAKIEQHDRQIRGALAGIERDYGIFVTGCDWSMAPRPGSETSIGAAIEAISGVPFGAWGTLAAVRAITEAVRAARVNRIGFSGVMLPLMEDTTLAMRNIERRYSVRDLLAFSSVCGTGLDTIPLAGTVSVGQIEQLLWEVAALSGALLKPLTARLLPMPGLAAGELTQIDTTGSPGQTQYFCQTRVMKVQ